MVTYDDVSGDERGKRSCSTSVVDDRTRYLDHQGHRRDFVRAACLMAALTSLDDLSKAAWMLHTIEMLAGPLRSDPN